MEVREENCRATKQNMLVYRACGLAGVGDDLLFPNPAEAKFCRIVMANPAVAGFFTI